MRDNKKLLIEKFTELGSKLNTNRFKIEIKNSIYLIIVYSFLMVVMSFGLGYLFVSDFLYTFMAMELSVVATLSYLISRELKSVKNLTELSDWMNKNLK